MSSNATCHMQGAPEKSPPLFQDGSLDIQAHHVGWLICGVLTIIASVTSFWLVNKHLQWYTVKREQRYIVRILFMVPIYATVSTASYLFWDQSTPLLLVRDCYESTVLTSFFYLLLMYVSHDEQEQKDVFRKVGLSKENDIEALKRGEQPKKWVFPLHIITAKPQDGLYFLQIMKWGVLQYCVIRPTTTLAAVILDYLGLYCEDSWSPGWGHVYITIIVSISVSVAMYCLIQLYVPVADRLVHHKPILKLFAIKAVVFLTFWQATFLSVLSTFGVVKDTKYMTAEEINIGIGAIAETFEMVIFAFVHIKAFTYKPYRPSYHSELGDEPPQRTLRFKALCHAMDFRETFRELWAGCVYIFRKYRGLETDPQARRLAHMEDVFGRSRVNHSHPRSAQDEKTNFLKDEKSDLTNGVRVDVEREVAVDVMETRNRRNRLSASEFFRGLGHSKRGSASVGFREQVEGESERRGYNRRDPSPQLPTSGITSHDLLDTPPSRIRHEKVRSWWQGVYEQISQSNPDQDPLEEDAPQASLRRSSRLLQNPSEGLTLPNPQSRTHNMRYDDAPPPSIINTYRSKRQRKSPSTRAVSPGHTPYPHANLPYPSPSLLHTHSLITPMAVDSNILRSDSMLQRAFAASPVSMGTSNERSAVTSNLTHGTAMSSIPPIQVVQSLTPQITSQEHGSVSPAFDVRVTHPTDGDKLHVPVVHSTHRTTNREVAARPRQTYVGFQELPPGARPPVIMAPSAQNFSYVSESDERGAAFPQVRYSIHPVNYGISPHSRSTIDLNTSTSVPAPLSTDYLSPPAPRRPLRSSKRDFRYGYRSDKSRSQRSSDLTERSQRRSSSGWPDLSLNDQEPSRYPILPSPSSSAHYHRSYGIMSVPEDKPLIQVSPPTSPQQFPSYRPSSPPADSAVMADTQPQLRLRREESSYSDVQSAEFVHVNPPTFIRPQVCATPPRSQSLVSSGHSAGVPISQ